MRGTAVRLAAVALLAAAPAAAQMPLAAPADVVAATEACRIATGAGGVDAAKLEAAGWSTASVSNKGKAADIPLRIFGKPGVKAILLFAASDKGRPLCSVTARLANGADFAGSIAALDQALATPHKTRPQDPNAAYWFPQDHLVQLQLTGKADAPGVRVGIMHMDQEKK